MKQFKHFKGLYTDENARKMAIYTKSLAPRINVYNENTTVKEGIEYREFNPFKSKLCAGLTKGISQIGIKPGSVVLYLGASTGTTVSHVSDIVGEDGFIFALDFAPRVVRELVFLSQQRPNIAPMLEDAFHPERYADKVSSAEIIFQDIAQRNQVDIFLRNVNHFLEDDGFAILALKARSIDVTVKPGIVFREVREELEKHLVIVDSKEIGPFEKDHMIFVCKKKGFEGSDKFDNTVAFEIQNREEKAHQENKDKDYKRSYDSGKSRTELSKKPSEYKQRKDFKGNYEKRPSDEKRTPNKRFNSSKNSTAKTFEEFQSNNKDNRNRPRRRRN